MLNYYLMQRLQASPPSAGESRGGPGSTRGEDLADMLLHARSPETRRQAAVALGDLMDPAGVPHLIRALSDPAPEVRLASILSLGRIGDPGALDALIAISKEEDQDFRLLATIALGQLGDRRSVGALARRLQDGSEAVRCAAAWALGMIGGEHPLSLLIPAMKDPSRLVSQEAERAILRSGASAAHVLAGALEDGDERFRWRILGLLVRIGTPVVPALQDIRIHGSPHAKELAEWALERLGDHETARLESFRRRDIENLKRLVGSGTNWN